MWLSSIQYSFSIAIILAELTRQPLKLDHEIVVLKTTPHYIRDHESLSLQHLAPRWGRFLFQSDYGGVSVYHASVNDKGSLIVWRLIDSFHTTGTLVGFLDPTRGVSNIMRKRSPRDKRGSKGNGGERVDVDCVRKRISAPHADEPLHIERNNASADPGELDNDASLRSLL